MCRLLIPPLQLEGDQSGLGMTQLPHQAIRGGRIREGKKHTKKRPGNQQRKERRLGKKGAGDVTMENLTETFADAFGNASHLIRFHHITLSTILTQSMLQKGADPQCCAFQAAKLC